jgi:hypothetical protein
MPVLGIEAREYHDGVTHILMPVSLGGLRQQYRREPRRTQKELVQVLATWLAPSIVLKRPPEYGDKRELDVWNSLWSRCRWAHDEYNEEYSALEARARYEVRQWLADATHVDQLTRVAEALFQYRYLGSVDFYSLVRPR